MSLLALLTLSAPALARPGELIRFPTGTGPYAPCEMYGMVWNGTRCVDPSGRDSYDFNLLAGLHNAALAADAEVRGEGDVTGDDMVAFFEAVAKVECADTPDCDPAASVKIDEELAAPWGGSSMDPWTTMPEMIKWEVSNGVMSDRLGEQLLSLTNDAASGAWSSQELLDRVQYEFAEGDWSDSDAQLVMTLVATTRASNEGWELTSPAARGLGPTGTAIADGVATVLWAGLCIWSEQWEFIEHAPHVGAFVSEVVSGHRVAPAGPSIADLDQVETPFDVAEQIQVDGSVYRMEANVSRDGAKVVVTDMKGNVVSDGFLDAKTLTTNPGDNWGGTGPEGQRTVVIPIWTGFGFIFVTIEIHISIHLVP